MYPYQLSKGLINIEKDDNACFRWCHVCLLNPQERNLQLIQKVNGTKGKLQRY